MTTRSGRTSKPSGLMRGASFRTCTPDSANQPLLGPDGLEVRPDRVVLRSDGSAAIIDYKFGQPEKKYLEQVRGYMDLYRSLGHVPVTGTLWYIRENGADEFVEV